MARRPAGIPSTSPVRSRGAETHDGEGDGGGDVGVGVGEGVGAVRGGWKGSSTMISLIKSSSTRGVGGPEGVSNLVGLTGDVPDVGGELGNEKEVSLSPRGPGGCGVGLGDGAGEGLVVHVDYHLPPLDEVLKLLDRGEDGQELSVEGGRRVPGVERSRRSSG